MHTVSENTGVDRHMPVLHLIEDQDGVSHFSDLRVPLDPGLFAPPAPAMPISDVVSCAGMIYLILPAGWGGAQHPSPRRQVAFCLSGRLRVTAGDGTVREFGAGAIWRMEDVNGSGHTTTVQGDEDVRLAIVQLSRWGDHLFGSPQDQRPAATGAAMIRGMSAAARNLVVRAAAMVSSQSTRAERDLQALVRHEEARRAVDRLLR